MMTEAPDQFYVVIGDDGWLLVETWRGVTYQGLLPAPVHASRLGEYLDTLERLNPGATVDFVIDEAERARILAEAVTR